MKVLSWTPCCRTAAVIIFLLLTLHNTNPAFAQSCTHGNVRLVGSDNSNEGRLEVCMNGMWGTVCDDGWGHSESKVVCRQLHYPVDEPGIEEDISHKCCAHFNEGNGSVFLDDLKCTGDESSLVDCSHAETTDCGHSEDVGVICPALCPESSIQLANGLTPYEGVVEVCMDGAWRGVCDHQWDYEDAFVACRQLGYPATGALPYDGSIIGSHLRPNITGLQCLGNESKLTDCKHSITATCGVSNTAAVHCKGEIVADGNCSEGALRLAGGNTEYEGRVELCSNGIWGTICDTNSWDSREATVVCKQLGYVNPRVYVFTYTTDSYFGKGTGVILLDSVNCEGTELTIQACISSSHDPHRCSHDTDVGVRCKETNDSESCTNGDVQLTGSESVTEGVVEICVDNTWGSICNDSWGQQEAAVVCKQLGFQSAHSSTYSAVLSVESAGPYHLDDVNCAGDEMNLVECSHNGIGVHDCATGKHARVRCDASECRHTEIRLAGGATTHEGRLEVCSNGQWGTVCDDIFTDIEASVVCKQLFGPHYESVHFCCGNYFGKGSGGLIFDDLRCSGSETRLLDCEFTNITDFDDAGCNHDDDIVIRCYNNNGCTHGDVRLVGGRTEMEGRVEICRNGIWGAIGDNDWDNKAATVICRQLQFPSLWSIPLTSSYFGRGTAPILASSMSCNGDEPSINDCAYIPISPETLFYWHYSVAGVMCQGNTTSTQECTSGKGRLVGGASENEGRVELCVDGFWGTACDDEWDQEDAIVLCRQIGLEESGATLFPGGSFGEGRGPVIGFDCSSRESNLVDCELTFGTLNCHHGRDAGVKCQAPHGYAVTVTTVPLQGPFIIGSTVMLHCSANIMPSECVTYAWKSSIDNPQLTSTSETSPNATISITAGHPKVGHYFCHIHSCSSSAVLGIGRTVVEVQGYLHPIGGEVLLYKPPERVTLSIAIGTEEVRHHFRDLRWYHNGVEIIPSGGVYFSDDNTTLTISISSETDRGTYEVKFTGLVVRPYCRSCEVAVLNLLREYPVLMPVVFYLQSGVTDETVGESAEQSTVIQFVGDANFNTVPFRDLDEITLDVYGKTDTSVDRTISTSWYHNGGELPLGSELGALKKSLQRISQSLEIMKLNQIVDSGVYEVDVNVDAYAHLVSHLQCPNAYAELVSNVFLADRITLDWDIVELKYYEPPVVVLETDKEAIADGEISTLTCSAYGGYPPIKTVSFTKDGNPIAVSSARRSLMVSTESVLGTPYGVYSCSVDNSVMTEQQTVLIKEKGNVLVQARFEDSGNCKEWNEHTLHQSHREVMEILLPIIKEECDCDFSISNFEDSITTCPELGEVLMFDITVVYSTEDGEITATFINKLLENWLINEGKTITLNGETVHLSSPLCQLNSSQDVGVSATIITGMFFGGLLTGILLISTPTIITCVIYRKKYHGSKIYKVRIDNVDGKTGEKCT